MYLRFFSALSLVIFVMFSSNSVYGQANSLKGYNFPNNSPFINVSSTARSSAKCTVGVGGTAIYPGTDTIAKLTGEALCDAEAKKRGVNKDYINWYASPVYGTWDSPGNNTLCQFVGNKMKEVSGNAAGGKWTNVVICKYEPFDCGDKWSYTLKR